MKRIRSIIVGSVAVYLASIAAILPLKSAFAGYRTYHSSSCRHFNDTEGTNLYNGAYVQNTTGAGKAFYCPVISDSEINLDVVTSLTVDVSEGTNGSYTRVCRSDYGSWSTTCGVQYDWGAGNGQAVPTVSAWDYPYDYGYLYNWVTDNSKIYGYTMWQ
jgi:hypothetical protein